MKILIQTENIKSEEFYELRNIQVVEKAKKNSKNLQK